MGLPNSQLNIGLDLNYDQEEQDKLNFRNDLEYITLNILKT